MEEVWLEGLWGNMAHTFWRDEVTVKINPNYPQLQSCMRWTWIIDKALPDHELFLFQKTRLCINGSINLQKAENPHNILMHRAFQVILSIVWLFASGRRQSITRLVLSQTLLNAGALEDCTMRSKLISICTGWRYLGAHDNFLSIPSMKAKNNLTTVSSPNCNYCCP